MTAVTRSLVAVAAGLSLAVVAGCGAHGENGDSSSAPPPKDPLTTLDSCSILTPQDLSTFGLEGPGSPEHDVSWSPGCYFQGDAISASVHTNFKETAESSQSKPVWAKFDRVDINGRPGATAITQGTTQARQCVTMFDAGRGLVDVQVSTQNPGDNSQCDQSQKIAKQIEPRMPKKQ